MEILGTAGVILIGQLQDRAVSVCTKEQGVVTSTFASWRNRFRDAYLKEIQHFIDCILEDKEPIVTGEDGKKAVEVAIAATKSILEGRPVNLPLPKNFKLSR